MKKLFTQYALEFLVVFLGISLSFGLNNWNEQNKRDQLESQYLKSLRDDFKTNLEAFDDAFDRHLAQDQAVAFFLSEERFHAPYQVMDSVARVVTINWSYNPNMGVANSLIYSGSLELIKNNEIKTLLSRLPDIIVDYTEEEARTEKVSVQLDEFMIVNYIFNAKNKAEERQNMQMMHANEFYNHVVIIDSWLKEILSEGPMFRAKLVDFIALLEQELAAK